MKTSFKFRSVVSNRRRRAPHRPAPARNRMLLATMLLAIPAGPAWAAAPVDLGAAAGFSVLAGSGITIAGAANSTFITGDIGTFPIPSITGLGNLVLTGVNQAGNGVTQAAKGALTSAYLDAAGRPFDVSYDGGFDLVGLTLAPGVYHDESSLFLSGTLTLDAQGDPNAVWIFQAGSTLITSSGSAVTLAGGAQACNVFWQVGSSATLGSGSYFAGSILALTSITLDTGAVVDGRVLAQDGAVTLDWNSLRGCAVVPEPGAAGMLAVTLAGALAFRRRVRGGSGRAEN